MTIKMKTATLFSLAISLIALQQLSIAQNVYSKQDEKTGLFGFTDDDGNDLVKPIYKEVDYSFGSTPGLYKVINKNDKTGFVNEMGKEVIPCKYDEIDAFDKGRATVRIKSGEAYKHGMIDTTGKEVIACIYDESISFEKGYAIVKIKTGQYEYNHGFVDSTGKLIIPAKYGKLDYYANDKVLIFSLENASDVGLMDINGKVIIPTQYQFWSKRISKGIWPVGIWPAGTNGVCGVVNLKNETVVPFIYEMIESYSDELNLALAKKDGKYGFIDRTGKTIIPFMYNGGWQSEKYLVVKKDGKWGIITVDNKTILPFEYYDISSISDKTAVVSKTETEEQYEIDLITKQKVK
jgi:hypothetical protein